MGATILVVDDHPDVRAITVHALEDAGFRVLQAATGTEALAMARQGIDLVVLDIMLPDIDGWEVCRRLKSAPETSSLLVLHLSGIYRSPEERVHGLDVGADGYLTQPVDPDELVASCRALLRARRATGPPNLRELMALAAVVAATSGPLDLPETMRRVAREAARLIGADTAVFWIVNEAEQTATPAAAYHVPKPLLARVRSFTFDEIPRLMLEAFRGRRIVAVPDAANDPRFQGSAVPATTARAVVAVPVFLKDRVFGCLVLSWWSTPHVVRGDEIDLLATIAGQAALAIENSRLYEETERERRVARAAEERYRALFHGTPAPVFRTTADGRVLECNDAFVRMLRYTSREQVLGLNAASFYADPADRATLIERLRDDRVMSAYEVQWRRTDNSRFWVALTVRLVGEGGAAHLDGVAIDISDRKRAEEALERYRLLFERSFVGIFRTRPDGVLLECNDAFARILGYGSAAEMQGRSVLDHYTRPEDRQMIVSKIAAGEDVVDAELVGRRRDGSEVPVAMSVRRIVDETGIVHEGTLVDLTDRKRAEEAATLRTVAELANAAAHQINNPLSVIVGDLELMRLGQLTPERLERLLAASETIREIVGHMLRITRVATVADWPADLPPILDIRRSGEPPQPA